MNENSNENGNSNNTEIEEVQAPAETATDEEKAEYIEKLESNNKQLYARAKKAEGFELKDNKWVKPVTKPVEQKTEATISKDTSQLSQSDLITIAKSDVHQEDISEVVEYATFKKITVAEALVDNVMKGILAEKAELRKVADGTNTGAAKRGNAKLSDDALLENARNGKFPESDEDMARLTRIGRGIK